MVPRCARWQNGPKGGGDAGVDRNGEALPARAVRSLGEVTHQPCNPPLRTAGR